MALEWIYLAQNWDTYHTLVQTVMNLNILLNG